MGNLIRRLVVVDSLTASLMAFTLIYPICMVLIRKIYREKKVIRIILGIIPFIIGGVLFPVFSVKSNSLWFLQRYLFYYILLGVLGIWMLIPQKISDKGKKNLYSIFTTILFIIYIPIWIFAGYGVIGIFGGPHLDNHSRQGWAESFESMTYDMEKYYVMRDWKDIDWDTLRSVYIPKVEEAEKNRDTVMYARILEEYIYEFHDSHIWIEGLDGTSVAKAEDLIVGNDYGFSMYRIDTGEIIAVLCNEDSMAYSYGIHNGTVIKSWNGANIESALESVKCIHNYPYEIKDNEEIMKPIFLAGQGEKNIEVGFLDDNGNEKTVVIEKIGSYRGRLEKALSCFYSFGRINAGNLESKMLTDDIAYLRVSIEQYEELHDILAYLTGKYPTMNNMLFEKLSKLQDEGMKKIIIDTRNNNGGYIEISMAVASQFNNVPLVDNEGIYSKGKYKILHSVEIKKSGNWSNIPVVVLTNDRCVSSGDCLVDLLSRSSNSVVMGITSSSGSAQEIGGISILSDDMFEIWYPVLATIDEEGLPLGDVTSQREGRIDLDIRIPVDYEGALNIFSDTDKDYELEYAIDYLKK